MKTIALNRLNILAMPKGEGLNTKQKLAFLVELAQMGYRLTNPELLETVSANFLLDYQHLMHTLAARKGGKVQYVTLFQGFPEATPDDELYYTKRIAGYMANILDWYPNATTLSNGTKVPKWLFDTNKFGADPITQMASVELWTKAAKAQKTKQADSTTVWHDLTLVYEEDLAEQLKIYLQHLVYAKSSIKEALHADLEQLLAFFGAAVLDVDLIVFKETQALLLKYFWNQKDWKAIVQLAKTATDILRLFAAVTGSDIALATPIKFPKMSRPARKTILQVLEKSASLPENLKQYKGLWLEIGCYLHPSEYAKQFPRTAEVFDALRNGKIETYNSKTEQLIAEKEIYVLLQHLNKKPGVFARRLHEVARTFPEQLDTILFAFEEQISQIPLKNLLVLERYFDTINEANYRAIVNKKGKMKVLTNNAFGALTDLELHKIVTVIKTAIHNQLMQQQTWEGEKVWIEEELRDYTVPLQQRKAMDGILTVGRGTRIEVDLSKVLRLFVYWKQSAKRTDLDLSIIQYDVDFNYVGHVSYTNLKTGGICHSGDLQDAPFGAAEFVDITMSALKANVKYLAVQINRYAGESFAEMTAHAGWMWRDKVSSDYKTFDIKTVANKFDLNGVGGYAIPLMVDIEQQHIISTDLYVGSKQLRNNVEGTHSEVALMCRALAQFTTTKPVLKDLAMKHVLARQADLVAEKEAATITFGRDKSCTYNVLEIEKVLTELI